MIDLEWAHAAIGLGGAVIGAVGTVFSLGWRLGKIESRLEASMQKAIADCEAKIETITVPFDETLKGLRQKINDVELNTERRFLPRDDFTEFREEYRDDMKELKDMIRAR